MTDGVAALVRNGGVLCLDYINTVEPRTGPVTREWLTGYPDLVEWARHGGLLDEAAAGALLRAATARPAAAQAAFRAAIDLREGLFRLFAAIVDGSAPAAADLEVLRSAFAAATRHGRLVPQAGATGQGGPAPQAGATGQGGPAPQAGATGQGGLVPQAGATGHGRPVPQAGGFGWAWDAVDAFDLPWWPVAASAMELLTHGPLDRIKQCPTDEGCSWLFLDTTKNRSRRWCSMDDCGSDIKARRQTDRRRAARRGTRG